MGIWSPFEMNLSPLLEHRAKTLFLPPFLAYVFKCKLLKITCHVVRALFVWRGPYDFPKSHEIWPVIWRCRDWLVLAWRHGSVTKELIWLPRSCCPAPSVIVSRWIAADSSVLFTIKLCCYGFDYRIFGYCHRRCIKMTLYSTPEDTSFFKISFAEGIVFISGATN